MDTAARQPLLKVEHLKQYFKVNKTFTVKAVDDISFEIFPGETYGLVGESGSGKSVTVKTVMGIRASNETVNAGSVEFTYRDGEKK